MQSLDVISVNLWQILVSLANLVILFLLIKKFLYKPVKKMLESRQSTIDNDYKLASQAKTEAEENKIAYEKKLAQAKTESDSIIQSAVNTAKIREDEIIAAAQDKAAAIIKKAENDAKLELKKAEETIKTEIVDVGTRLAGRILEREVSKEDNKELVDSFIKEMGDTE